MKITIVGCGNMGKGLAQRLSSSHTLYLYDRNNEKSEGIQREGHGKACQNLEEALKQSDIVILAVKPNALSDVANLIHNEPPTGQILVSILAGTPIARIKKEFPQHRIIRMMPNLALIYGEGIIGLSVDEPLTDTENEQLLELCKQLGKVYWLDEAKINAFTALASSGPAFVLAIIESMVEAGIRMGFNAPESRELVQQMMKGTLLLLEKSNKLPDELKKQIASPGGTTMAGLKKFEVLAVREGIINTFFAAYERANELSSEFYKEKNS